jgi:hypothetical protein
LLKGVVSTFLLLLLRARLRAAFFFLLGPFLFLPAAVGCVELPAAACMLKIVGALVCVLFFFFD